MIDLFAGPGGLGEGFSSVRDDHDNPVFKIALSVEMDEHAHKTLELRAFYRQFDDKSRPEEYYAYLRSPSRQARNALFAKYPRQAAAAKNEAWHHELREETAAEVTERARKALRGRQTWVLIGGPPCQAYSLVGRARRKNDETFAADHKHTLYKRYLRLIEDLRPPVFVMENVKGMLSAKLGEKSTIDMVLDDLREAGPGYEIYSFVKADKDGTLEPADFVIRAEEYGIPQCRHRVILLGIRKTPIGRKQWGEIKPLARWSGPVSASMVLQDLPRLRSRISRRQDAAPDSDEAWRAALQDALGIMKGANRATVSHVKDVLRLLKDDVPPAEVPIGLPSADVHKYPSHTNWYCRDRRAPINLNHNSRAHMRSDLARYLFCSCFASACQRPPKLEDFPECLLPNHKSTQAGVADSHFGDRFRVQMKDRPATTITSHISKDGHYYIHYDPSQCRSLSVREAARLQTFPDDYFFEGNRTQQYHQVGNAVPPLLATQLGETVAGILGATTKGVFSG